MIFKILQGYILGYVNIYVEGYYIERFINTCISKSILIWNVKREKSTQMYANVRIQDFKKLKEITKKTKCKMKIRQRKGVPFLLNKYRKRKIFVIFLIIIISAMFGTSRFVWNIEVQGENIAEQEILENLAEYGLKPRNIKVENRYK